MRVVFFLALLKTVLVLHVSGAVTAGYNTHEYRTLCKLYHIAISEPEMIGVEEVRKMVDEAANYSNDITILEKNFSSSIGEKDEGVVEVEIDRVLKRAAREAQVLNAAAGKQAPGLIQDIQSIREKLLKAALSEKQSVTELLGKPKTHFLDANVETVSSLTTNTYAAACKTTGSISIINDLVCLCGANSGAPSQTPCKAQTGFDFSSKDYSNAGHVLERWRLIKGDCKTHYGDLKSVTPSSIRSALSDFKSLFGTNIFHTGGSSDPGITENNKYIYGGASSTSAAVADCDGQERANSNSRGICINYKEYLSKGDPIPWVKNLLEAASLLEKAEKEIAGLKLTVSRLKQLQDKAEITFLSWKLRGKTAVKDKSDGTKEIKTDVTNAISSEHTNQQGSGAGQQISIIFVTGLVVAAL